MEFETEEPIGELLKFVYENGFHRNRDPAFLEQLVDVFELRATLGRRTQEVSKGELQRTILAFSLLYGSRILLMDEPIFALEPYQKTRAMSFLVAYAREHSLAVYYSAHELDITQKYSDTLLVLYEDDRPPLLGPTKDLFKRDIIEKAYDVPMSMLKRKESVYREALSRARRY
jgi:ABC-type cobalamin/Fe3+-siderophores transport system ATPase subunit